MNESDDDLIARVKGGDIAAFEGIVKRYQDRIYNICVYMLKDRQKAQEAAQDVFVKAYGNLKDYQPRASLYTWLYRIAINTSIDYLRKFPPVPMDHGVLADLPCGDPSPERCLETRETTTLVQNALQKLPTELKTAIVLREIEGLAYEEIAAVLHVSVGTVKSRISRAREALRRLLREKSSTE
jgi:RNA polymerase sigma-70 factor (ECF subfamily)